MILKHTKPCTECPWRKKALKGWLGGHRATFYADAVAAGEAPACHQKDYGPEDDRTAFCAGALICMKNQAMLPVARWPGQETVVEVMASIQRDPTVFRHHADFYHWHTDKQWIPPILRQTE